MLSNVQIRLLHGVDYRSWDTFCLWDTAINCLGFRMYSHDKDSSCETSAAFPDTSRRYVTVKIPERRRSIAHQFSLEKTFFRSNKLRIKFKRTKIKKMASFRKGKCFRWRKDSLSCKRFCGQVRTIKSGFPRVTSWSSCWLVLYYIKVLNRIIKRVTLLRIRSL